MLVVDDQPLVRKGLACVVRDHLGEARVCEAADAEAAVEAARACGPDLVLLDAELAGVRGSALIPRITAAAPKSKVVMMALHPTLRDVRASFGAGADGYLSKDASIAELDLALTEIEHGGRYLDPRVGASLASDETAPPRLASLTERERHVLELVSAGLTNREIAEEIGMSLRTVEANRARAQHKLDLHTRADVVAYVHGDAPAGADA